MIIYEVYDDDGRTHNFYLKKETAEKVKDELNASSDIFEYYVSEVTVIED